ncbi:MAG: alpha-L-fucosidase [Acidobacteria bacterium]|nr:alpha-L-fucosidase [Acidobacteriota bacterium]
MTRRELLAALPLSLAAQGVAPSARHLLWHKLEFYGFLHFTMNTFTDKEWGYGDEQPSLFNPTAFDADQIIEALASAGMKGVILTAKHHDGFCLWPTKTTEHSVKHSPWRNGQGDVVKEIAAAARRKGLAFGVYLSPWDRNHPHYGKPEYVQVYRAQLRELLTNYGPIFEVWHDGANGGDGFYGGAREKRTIDKHSYYQWPGTWDMVRKLQPNAVIFSDVGPDIRWVGNESGFANETCWATYSPVGPDGGPPAPGHTRYKEGGTGHRNGAHWMPAECDVSIRPGWFWHENQNVKVKSPRQLMDLYYKSVGRGASFLLNVPPDRRGLIHEADAASLKAFGNALRTTFLKRDQTFDVIRLREDIRHGQRIDSIEIDIEEPSGWRTIARATSVGACRLIKLDQPVTAKKVRHRVTQSTGPARITEFGLYKEQGL